MTLLEAATEVIVNCGNCEIGDCNEHEELRAAVAAEPVPGEVGRPLMIAMLHKTLEAGDLARQVLAEICARPI